MNITDKIIVALFLGLLFSAPAHASDGSIRILYPEENIALDSAAEKFDVLYSASFNPKGDHVHLSIDGKDKETLEDWQISQVEEIYQKGQWLPIMREINGKTAIKSLARGRHEICAQIVDKEHVPIGEQTCIHVLSK